MDGAGKTWKELAVIGGLEALGTAILLVAINFSNGNPTVIVMGILTGAVLSGRLTGAHFNPAVTVAVFISEKTSKFKSNIPLAGVMIISQLIGGLLGQLFATAELGKNKLGLILPPPYQNFNVGETLALEMFFTFVFISCLLHNVFPRLSIQSDTVLAVASVCVSLYFGIKVSSGITGACLNPAVGLANYSVYAMFISPKFAYFPAYFFGPLFGGVLAGLAIKFLVMPSVPNFYDDLLTQIRDVQNEIINVKLENNITPTNYLPPTKNSPENRN